MTSTSNKGLDTVKNSPSYLRNIPCLSFRDVVRLSPCQPGFSKAWLLMPRKEINAAQARELGFTIQEISWAAWKVSRSHPLIRRRMKHWVADCAYKSLHLYKHDRWPLEGALNAAIREWQFDRLIYWLTEHDPQFLV